MKSVVVGLFCALSVLWGIGLAASPVFAQQNLNVNSASFKIVPDCPSTGCRACDLVKLVNNVLQFIMVMAVVIAVFIIAFAGLHYVTSQHGSMHDLLGMLSQIVVGIIIMLCGWLIIDTVFKYLVGNQQFGVWNKIDCLENPKFNEYSPQYVATSPIIPGSSPGGASQPGAGQQQGGQQNQNGQQGQNQTTPTQGGVGNCSPEALSGFGSNASVFSCIAKHESGCTPGAITSADVGADGKPVSFGLFQINLSANNLVCNGQTYNCKAAFSTPYTARDHSTVVVNPALYDQCKALALNADCNTQTAQHLYNQGGLRPWNAQRQVCGF